MLKWKGEGTIRERAGEEDGHWRPAETKERPTEASMSLPAILSRPIALIGVLAGLSLSGSPAAAQEGRAAIGPLRVHPANPRYFTDGSGKAVYLTGAHTWNNLQDIGL